MIDRYTNYKENIVHSIVADNSEKDVFLISGGFGTGKSKLVEEILADLKAGTTVDGMIYLRNDNQARFLTELLHEKSVSVLSPSKEGNVKYKTCPLRELEFNYEQFIEHTNALQKMSDDIYRKFCLVHCLKSSHVWAAKYLEIKDDSKVVSEFVRANFSKKSVIRLLLDTYTLSAESLIVNLMNIYFPMLNSGDPNIFANIKKKKILLCFDEIDSINGSVYMFFLNYLIPYFFNKTFADFASYRISVLDTGMKVTDFFDFKILISSRNNFESVIRGVPEPMKSRIYNVELENLSQKEFAEITSQIEIPSFLDAQKYYEATFGIPALVFDKNNAGQSGDFDFSRYVADKAYRFITKDFTDDEINILTLLPFMEEVGTVFLQYCDELAIPAFEVENFLMYNQFLLKNPENYAIKPEIKQLIRNQIKFNNRKLFDRLNAIAQAINKIADLLADKGEDEVEVMEILAFMPEENHLELSTMVINLEALKEFRRQNKNLFVPTQGQYILKQDCAERIRAFVKAVNPDKFQELTNLPSQLKSGVPGQRANLEVKKTAEIRSLEKEKKNIDEKIRKIGNEFKVHQKKMIDIENSMIEKRRLINDNSYSTNIMVAVVSTIFAFAVLMVAIFIPNFVNPEYDNSPIYSIQFIMYCIFFVLLVITTYLNMRAFKSFKKKGENAQYTEEIAQLEEEKLVWTENMQKCKDETENLKNRKKEIDATIHAELKKSIKKQR